MESIGQDAAAVLSPAPMTTRAAHPLAGPGDDDDDDDELPIGDPPDDDVGDDPDEDDDDDDEEPLQAVFALQHRHGARIAAQCRPGSRDAPGQGCAARRRCG